MAENSSMYDRAKAFVRGRQLAYKRLFDPKSEDAKTILKDLAQFCRAHETSFHPDPRVHAVLEGRREVWLRIQNHIKMDPEALWKITGRKDSE